LQTLMGSLVGGVGTLLVIGAVGSRAALPPLKAGGGAAMQPVPLQPATSPGLAADRELMNHLKDWDDGRIEATRKLHVRMLNAAYGRLKNMLHGRPAKPSLASNDAATFMTRSAPMLISDQAAAASQGVKSRSEGYGSDVNSPRFGIDYHGGLLYPIEHADLDDPQHKPFVTLALDPQLYRSGAIWYGRRFRIPELEPIFNKGRPIIFVARDTSPELTNKGFGQCGVFSLKGAGQPRLKRAVTLIEIADGGTLSSTTVAQTPVAHAVLTKAEHMAAAASEVREPHTVQEQRKLEKEVAELERQFPPKR